VIEILAITLPIFLLIGQIPFRVVWPEDEGPAPMPA